MYNINMNVVYDACNELFMDVDICFDIHKKMSINNILWIAEACNFAAKVINYDYYNWKAKIVAEVICHYHDQPSHIGYWDGCYYIYDDQFCQFSFHDPFDDIYVRTEWKVEDQEIDWIGYEGRCDWIGIRMQEYVFEIISDYKYINYFNILRRKAYLFRKEGFNSIIQSMYRKEVLNREN